MTFYGTKTSQTQFRLLVIQWGGAIASAFAATQPVRIGQLVLLAPAGMEILSGKLVKFIVGTPIIGDWLILAFYPNELRKGIQAERKLPAHVPRISD